MLKVAHSPIRKHYSWKSPFSSRNLRTFWMPPQCDYHTINCQVSKIALIDQWFEVLWINKELFAQLSSHLSGVMRACVSDCNRSMNCLPWLDFLRLYFVTVIQALKSTNRIDSVTMDTHKTAVYARSSFWNQTWMK